MEDLVVRGQRIRSEMEVEALCAHVVSLLIEEPNCARVSSPVTVCGDIHGQFADLVELFRTAGSPADGTKFIFLGDYVDRGRDGVEVFELLLCYKALYPTQMTLLRGNHESRQITQVYGFYDECLWKYGSASVWKACSSVFDCLNVAALVDDNVLCVHGGLSPQVHTLDQIHTLYRADELPTQGALCDLLWSDPADDTATEDWQPSNRGAGFLFGPKVADRFLHTNNLRLLCRAHQLVMDGFKHHFDRKNVVTVWSAPNYCGRCGNIASFLKLESHLSQRFVTFDTAAKSSASSSSSKFLTSSAEIQHDLDLFGAPDAPLNQPCLPTAPGTDVAQTDREQEGSLSHFFV